MNDSQILSQLTSGGSGATTALQGIQSAIQATFWIGLVLSVILTIVFIIYIVYKMRVQSAILRIDKNLQKLVDFQVPATQEATVSDDEPENTDKNQSEQN